MIKKALKKLNILPALLLAALLLAGNVHAAELPLAQTSEAVPEQTASAQTGASQTADAQTGSSQTADAQTGASQTSDAQEDPAQDPCARTPSAEDPFAEADDTECGLKDDTRSDPQSEPETIRSAAAGKENTPENDSEDEPAPEEPVPDEPLEITAVVPEYESVCYTGEPLKPSVTVYQGENTLKAGTDYTVRYKNNKEIGTATITVKGKNAYKGTLTSSFEITKVPITSVKLKYSEMTYTGKACTQKITVKARLAGKTVVLTKGTDYTVSYKNNKEPGKASVTVKAAGIYSGKITKKFTISRVPISDVRLNQLTCGYTGQEKKPGVTVTAKLNGKTVTLKKGTDYKVSYKNNKKIGKATVVVTGKGHYKGTVKRNFTIHMIDYVAWAKSIADDDRYVYGHTMPKTYETYQFSCSTLVGAALYLNGYFNDDPSLRLPANSGWLGGLHRDKNCLEGALLRHGFKYISAEKLGAVNNIAQDNINLLKPGDIMWRFAPGNMHVGIYMGDGMFIESRGGTGPYAIGCFPEFNYFRGIFRLSDSKLR